MRRSIKVNNMISKFKLWPVGQGLFYSGTINAGAEKSFNFIYDCGNDKDSYSPNINSIVDGYINYFHTKESKPTLDMLVISHFDTDHVSGLERLFSKVDVEKIFIPYYGLGSYLLFLSFVLGYNIPIDNLEIILVEPPESLNGEQDDNQTNGMETTEFADSGTGDYLISGIKVSKLVTYSFIESDWRFKFYNAAPKSANNYTQIKVDIDDLIKHYGHKNLRDLLTNNISQVRQDLKNIYKKYVSTYLGNSKQNQTSLCLYHEPAHFRGHIKKIAIGVEPVMNFKSCLYNYYNLSCFVGTMLVGDLSLKSGKRVNRYQDFSTYFKMEKDRTKVFQIPHHGANTNWNDNIIVDFKQPIFINSSGLGNKHRHPNTQVIQSIQNNACLVLGSNQIQSIEYVIWS